MNAHGNIPSRTRRSQGSRFARRRPRGYSMAFVILILAVLGIALSAFFFALTSSSKTTSSMLNRRKAFYACDGVGRIFIRLGQQYLDEEAGPHTAEGLRNYICQVGGGCTAGNELPHIRPDGYRVTEFQVATGESYTGVIPNGAFEGMQARQSNISFSLRGERDDHGFVCQTDQSVTLGQVSMFQFFVFSDGYADWLNPAPQLANGRVHVNGDFCTAAQEGYLRIRRLTASREIFHPGSSGDRCRATNAAGVNAANLTGPHISKDGSFIPPGESGYDASKWAKLTAGNDATRSNWSDYAISVWNGNVRDRNHGTPHLKLPISGTPRAQAGIDADYDTASNTDNSKFLVDPLLDTDSNDIAEQKFACKADIRILNGVWYLRDDDGSPCGWPGTPIWSDHPGNFTGLDNEYDGVEEVGQGHLYTARGWSGLFSGALWGTRSVPAGYSYYQSDPKNLGTLLEPILAPLLHPLLGSTVTPVISYGALKKVSNSPPRWEPGHWVDNTNEGVMCNGGDVDAANLYGINDNGYCHSGDVPVSKTARLLNATRSGFVDVQARNTFSNSSQRAARSRVLPINFDLAAFAAALNNTGPGELGAHFASTGRTFNGIVYISSDWDGALDGMDDAQLPELPPVHGARVDGEQAQHSGNHSQRALPYPLCAPTGTPGLPTNRVLAKNPSNTVDLFKVPSCANYTGNNAMNSRPNALRIFNGANISETTFPEGLTIATNLPTYLLGDINSSSDVSDSSATPWVPVLIAADHITVLSNAWSDEKSGWHADLSGTWNKRDASETMLNLAILTGWVPSGSSKFGGAINNFATYMEDWNGVEQHFNGSIVLGFHSSFWRWRFTDPHGSSSTYAYRPPNRVWAYDPHFDFIANQPPGAPLYNVSATMRWSR